MSLSLTKEKMAEYLEAAKSMFGSRTMHITGCGGGYAILTVKGTSIGTNIKDQKERMAEFWAAMEPFSR